MKFECDVKGCNFKTAKHLEALTHIRIHKKQQKEGRELYELMMKFVVDKEFGK